MNLIKELLVLKEEDEVKLPSFGEMQKAIYKVAIAHFVKANKSFNAHDLQREADNDRFWTSSFDDAYEGLQRYAGGRVKNFDYVYDDIANSFDDVVEKIVDYYSDRMNFEPGVKLPKIVHPQEVDGDEIEAAILGMSPALGAKIGAEREHSGVVDAMHKDFVKIANRQRMGKEGKALVNPYIDAVQQVVSQLEGKKAQVIRAELDPHDNTIEVVVRCDTVDSRGKETPIEGADFVDADDINVPSMFDSNIQFKKSKFFSDNPWASYTFKLKDEVPANAVELVQDELGKKFGY